jgi:hypothetical protein
MFCKNVSISVDTAQAKIRVDMLWTRLLGHLTIFVFTSFTATDGMAIQSTFSRKTRRSDYKEGIKQTPHRLNIQVKVEFTAAWTLF